MSSTMHIPLRAIIVFMIIIFIVFLINIGFAIALNVIIFLVVVSLLSFYYIIIACLV